MPSTFVSIILILIPIIISIIALLHSTGVITRFELKVFIDGYTLPKLSFPNENTDSFPIILPIIFNNSGNRPGVIEDVILIVKNKTTNDRHIYSPVLEIDLQKYINGKRTIDAENINFPFFFPFSLKGNESCIKSILFTRETSIKGMSGLPTKLGDYFITVMVKITGKDYKNEFELNVNHDEEVNNTQKNENSVYYGRINFPYNNFKMPK